MTIAATQLREYLEGKYPGVRISRLSCRLTAGGSISQHSAYDGYDSNAMDIMGGPLGQTFDQNVALIQTIVDDVEAHRDDWSIRLILWQVPDHFGHAHFDFYPTMTAPAKWCGSDVTPRWTSSDGTNEYTRDPEPENGRYEGNDEMLTFADWANGLFDHIDDGEITALREAGYWNAGSPDVAAADQFWIDMRDKGTVGRTPGERQEVARFVQTCEVSAWLNAAPR